MPRRDGGLQKIERAGHVYIDKCLCLEACDIRFVQGTRMNDRFDAVLGEGTLHDCIVRNRPYNVRVHPGCHIETDDKMTGGPEPGREKSAKPTR